MVLQSSSSWSGALPHPDEFCKYPPEVQERMMRWNDAGTIDESKRQDRLVDEQIRQARLSPRRSMAIVLAAMALAAVSEWAFEATTVAIAFIAAPVLVYGTSLLTKVFSRSSRSERES